MIPRRWMALCFAAVLAGCDDEVLIDAELDPVEPIVQTPEDPATAPAPAPDPAILPPPTAPVEPFALEPDHVYFPIRSGTLWVYEGNEDGEFRRDEIRVLPEKTVISGTACTALYQLVFIEGELAEVTTEWFAQDADGNIWKFGEESFELEDGAMRLEDDSWIAGVDGTEPWMLFPAQPIVGETYVGNHGNGEDSYQVLSLTAEITVAAGTFSNCMKVVENPEDPEDSDIIIYSPGVGMVSEQSADGGIELVSVTNEE